MAAKLRIRWQWSEPRRGAPLSVGTHKGDRGRSSAAERTEAPRVSTTACPPSHTTHANLHTLGLPAAVARRTAEAEVQNGVWQRSACVRSITLRLLLTARQYVVTAWGLPKMASHAFFTRRPAAAATKVACLLKCCLLAKWQRRTPPSRTQRHEEAAARQNNSCLA